MEKKTVYRASNQNQRMVGTIRYKTRLSHMRGFKADIYCQRVNNTRIPYFNRYMPVRRQQTKLLSPSTNSSKPRDQT